VGLCRWLVVRPADGPGDLFDTLAAALARPEALSELTADGTPIPAPFLRRRDAGWSELSSLLALSAVS
jgi:hypothetical protein